MRKQISNLVSGKADEVLDLVVNLTGKYVNENKRAKLKKKAELELNMKTEEARRESAL